MLCTIFVLILILGVGWAYKKISTGFSKSSRHLVGKVVIVTGGNAGIGYETAKDMAERGARVILACRHEGRGTAARDQIIEATVNSDVHYRNLDLASFKSVRDFAENIIKTEKRIDILINNAGVCGSPFSKTEDGLNFEMQTNHFGPFLLTNLLLPLLRSSAPSRIILVSSLGHWHGEIDFDNLNMEKEIESTSSRLKTYCNSKLCNVLMAVELTRRLEGTGVTAYSLHPGAVVTDILGKNMPLMKMCMWPMMTLFYKNAWEGAQTTIHCAVAPEVVSSNGRYFSDCEIGWTSKLGRDEALARKLWDESERIVKIKN